jgi:hypothetical protein
MYPVPRNAQTVVHEWVHELAAHFGCAESEVERSMSFPHATVLVELMDGSAVRFKFAFALVSEAKRAIAVFTEHCGHHVLPYHEARVFSDDALLYEQQRAV